MTFRNTNFYFETSAVNYLAAQFNANDGIATKALQATKGNIWYLSPVTIWEILLTKNVDIREKILFYSQHVFHERLLNSPSEFIFNYIEAGCPLVEKFYDFHSKSPIANVWNNLCQDKNLTFIVDVESLRAKTRYLQKLSKQLNKVLDLFVFDIKSEDYEANLQSIINIIYNDIKPDLQYSDPNYHRVTKVAIILSLYVICIESDLERSAYDKFWRKIKIDKPLDRLFYISKNLKSLFTRGPIYQMAIMAFHQLSDKQKLNRGLIMDCFHSIYLTYADVFLTNDKHFSELKLRDLHSNFDKIFHLSEITISSNIRTIY